LERQFRNPHRQHRYLQGVQVWRNKNEKQETKKIENADRWIVPGNAIEVEDDLIAAIAKVHALTVVTGNTHHFERVKGVKLVDWELKPPKVRRP
jgi:predicted nucleic acid-binding protein